MIESPSTPAPAAARTARAAAFGAAPHATPSATREGACPATSVGKDRIPALEDHGLELEKYDWVPVLRKRRADGWTSGLQRAFIEALADTGSVTEAARVSGMSVQSCYRLRRAPGSESFSAAWSAAIDAAANKLIDEAFERALIGSDEPVFDRDGMRVGRRFRQSDKMLQFLLRAYMPERFRHAAHDARAAREAPTPVIAPVAKALEALTPPPPEAPHTLMPLDDLKSALQDADMCDGKLPLRLRDPDPVALAARHSDPMPLGEQFERDLEDAKRENRGKPPLSDQEWQTIKRDRFA